MKNIPKAGLLIVTLVIPALIFLFLRIFATNHYNLPYLNPEIGSNGKVVIVKGDTAFARIDQICPFLGHADQKVTVVSYLPAVCSDTCDMVSAGLKRVSNLSADIENLQIVTLTASGSQLERLPKEAGTGKWRVSGIGDTLTANCFADAKWTSTDKDRKPIAMENRLMLIDTAGYFRGYYDGAREEEIDRLMAEIKILDYERVNSVEK